MSNLYDILSERGFVQQVTDADAVRDAFAAERVTLYVGYDPTGDSLHIGHLFTVMALSHVERAGHDAIALVGGGTAMVGDPSGKSELRQMLTRDDIQSHVASIGAQLQRLLPKTRIVDNSEWLLELNYIDFLRDIGRHFSVNKMLSAEAYKQRLERGLSFIEFNYQLLQAYDFLELCRRHGCTLQLGGDDQWGNILAGVDLVRRLERKQVQGMTFPLLTTATGEKMGKTAAGAVWLAEEKLSPYDFYQYWVNVHDTDVSKLLGIFTHLPMSEVNSVSELGGVELNVAKSILAYEVTRFVHGAAKAREAHRAAQGAFGGRSLPQDVLPSSDVPRSVAADADAIPTTELLASSAADGFALIELMVLGGLADSKGAARRLVKQGAVRVGEEKASDEHARLSSDVFAEGPVTIRAGKKRVHRYRLQS